MERQLIEDYQALIVSLLPDMQPENYDTAVALAKLAQDMRGFGHIKEQNVRKAQQHQKTLLAQFRSKQEVWPLKLV